MLDHHSPDYNPDEAVDQAEMSQPDYPETSYKEYKGGDIPPELIYIDSMAYYIAHVSEDVDDQRTAVLVKWVPF